MGVPLVNIEAGGSNIMIDNIYIYTGWWFGTFFIFPLGIIIPID